MKDMFEFMLLMLIIAVIFPKELGVYDKITEASNMWHLGKICEAPELEKTDD